MSETQLTKNADEMQLRSRYAGLLQRKLPYIAVLTLAVSGVTYTNISHQPLVGYWEFLALATGVRPVLVQAVRRFGRIEAFPDAGAKTLRHLVDGYRMPGRDFARRAHIRCCAHACAPSCGSAWS